MLLLQARQEEVRAKCKVLLAKAAELIGMDIPEVTISFNLRGRVAGWASRRGPYHNSVYAMRFNSDMMQNQSWDHIINETVPHEIAHIACFVAGTDRGHGVAWRRMCVALGGSGATRHKEAVVFAKGKTFVYTTSTGHTVNVSETIHRRIQMGKIYRARNKGSLTNVCAYSLLGEPVTQVAPTKEMDPMLVLGTKKVEVPLKRPAAGASETKAARYRARIAQALECGEDDEAIIQFGITELGMTRQLSRAYLKANRGRV